MSDDKKTLDKPTQKVKDQVIKAWVELTKDLPKDDSVQIINLTTDAPSVIKIKDALNEIEDETDLGLALTRILNDWLAFDKAQHEKG